MSLETELSQFLRDKCIGAGVQNKSSIATHFKFKGYEIQYYGMTDIAEQKFVSILARCEDESITTYIHELFSFKHALLFDIDGKPNSVNISELLNPIYASIRTIFDIEESLMNCVIFSANSSKKMSYHIHFPDIIVNKNIMKMLYDHILKKYKWLEEYIDYQIVSNQKLRMPFSDKWNKDENKAEGRKLIYYGLYNNQCKRICESWESDNHAILYKGLVRRNDLVETTPVKPSVECIETLTMCDKYTCELSYIELMEHEENDFQQLTPEYHSLQKMTVIIDYLKQKYQSDPKTLCSKIVKFMNNFVCMICDHPGKVIYIVKKCNSGKLKQKWTYIQKSETDFIKLYKHVKVLLIMGESNGTKVSCKTIADIWSTHAEKQCYSTIIFDPNPKNALKNRHEFNTYQGLFITQQECLKTIETSGIDYKARVEPILSHIREVWCADNPFVFSYVLKWIAHAILKPWIKMGVALVLVGSEGCGKSMIIDALGLIFGTHYLHVTDMDDLVGRFTSILMDKLLVFADEAFWAGCKSLSGKLKGMITEKQIRCEHKGFDTYYVDSFSNFVMASNHHFAVPAGENARRWCCLGCTSKYNGNAEYFEKLSECIYGDDNMGLKCLVVYLMKNVDLCGFVPSKFPMTSLLRSQKESSFDTLESWWDQVLHRGYIMDWQDYQTIDPTFEQEDKTRGMVAYTKGPKYGYQMIPLQRAYNIYQEEMRLGTHAKIFNFQRFKQFLKDKNCFEKCRAPTKTHFKEVWIIVHFKKCRTAWRKVYNDPEMEFEVDDIE